MPSRSKGKRELSEAEGSYEKLVELHPEIKVTLEEKANAICYPHRLTEERLREAEKALEIDMLMNPHRIDLSPGTRDGDEVEVEVYACILSDRLGGKFLSYSVGETLKDELAVFPFYDRLDFTHNHEYMNMAKRVINKIRLEMREKYPGDDMTSLKNRCEEYWRKVKKLLTLGKNGYDRFWEAKDYVATHIYKTNPLIYDDGDLFEIEKKAFESMGISPSTGKPYRKR